MKLKLRNFFVKKENLYLTLALFFGLLMAFFNPPFSGVPDEGAHFLRAWSIAQGNVACHSDGVINKAALGLAEELKPIKINGSSDEKIALGKIKKALFEKDSKENVTFGGAVCGSNSLGYLPQVVGIELSRIIDVPVLWGFYFARFLNMLAAVFITYLALCILPFGKIVFMIIALLPMTIQQFSSFSYDPLHIATIFLFSAYVLKLAVGEEEISRKKVLILGVIAILAANIKFGFLPILVLLLLLSWKKFGTKKQYCIFLGATIFLSILFFYVGQGNTVGSEGSREGVYPLEQMLLVFKNPFGFLYAVFYTLYDGSTFFLETFLYKPGWLKDSLSPLWYVFVLFGMVILVRSEDEEVPLRKWQRFVLGGAFFAGFLFVFFSLYVLWSKIGGEKIQGVQGRYFIAISPLLILAFYKSKFDFRFDWIRRNINKTFTFFVLIFFFFSLFSLWNIYYDKTESTKKYIYDQQMSKEKREMAEIIVLEKGFTQTLKAKRDDLLGVKLYLKKDLYSGKTTFYLKDSDCKEVIRKKELVWDMDEFSNIEVKFGVITNAKDKKFCLEAELIAKSGLPFRISRDVYIDGEAIFDGAVAENDLIFDLMYKN